MVGENFNVIIDEMIALIVHQNKQRVEPSENELIDEFCGDRHCIGAQCLSFHPFGAIFYCDYSVLIANIPTN
jgi:hypothetical protein